MQKKIAIIAHTERNYVPYIEPYVTFFKGYQFQVDCFFWNREEQTLEHENEYIFYYQDSKSKLSKVIGYCKYREFIVSHLKEKEYDFLIILTSLVGIILNDYLLYRYKKRYLFDIRDYSFEKYTIYKKKMNQLIDASQITAISSPGFWAFLDKKDNMYVHHNINFNEVIKPYNRENLWQNPQEICVGFIGGVRYEKQNRMLIDALSSETKYKFIYIGKLANNVFLDEYCKEKGYSQVSFLEKYQNSEKGKLYGEIDVINSIYGNDSLEVQTALPNRLYDAARYRIPIMSSSGTLLSVIIQEYGVGIVIDLNEPDTVSQRIEDFFYKTNYSQFVQNCIRFLEKIKWDEDKFLQQLQKIAFDLGRDS